MSPPHLLELFSGTGSIGKVFRAAGWRVTSVDCEPRFGPTICCDVLQLEPGMVQGSVDLIWASPPCTHYSIARTTAKTPRDLEGSDRLVQKVLDLADQFFCYYFMENPQSGLLKGRDVVEDIPMFVVDYCMYADASFPHKARKRTSIWTNTSWMPARRLCNKDCGYCVGGRHLDVAQRGPAPGRPTNRHSLEQLYAIPPELAGEIQQWAELNVRGAGRRE